MNDTKSTIAKNLRKYRLRAGMTQEQAAEAVEKDQSYISRVENGEYTPLSDTLALFAKAYKVKPGVFYEENNEPERLKATA